MEDSKPASDVGRQKPDRPEGGPCRFSDSLLGVFGAKGAAMHSPARPAHAPPDYPPA